MSSYFFKGIPEYRMNGFCAVRDSFDNLNNLLHLAEIVNTCAHCMISDYEDDFDIAIFSGDYTRALVRNNCRYFSMAIPFQVINLGESICFNCDAIEQGVSGIFISIIRNALATSKNGHFFHEEIICSISDAFGLDVDEVSPYYDTFVSLLSDDHGYFRFDDDIENENGNIHPRYHFDFFYKNTTSIKIGCDSQIGIECFYSLFDSRLPKRYLKA